ncbi:hypothetical protein [Nitrosopumilus sp.]|uniref:hypothetical protein n=1 Tax=Nitrosopumilus sp. TaxID=2024843 RepID=UPI00247CC75D|nr:hypothetical protein [Nitrosopumilus sp.]MCV0430434.1 hypothetical protein [Nitrosopumilus sp.]
MKMDSCRKCGIEMDVNQTCSVCREPIKFKCKKCHYFTDEQIHSTCKLVDMNYKQPVFDVI